MSQDFKFTRFNAFGWILHRKTLEAGDTYAVSVPEAYDPQQGQNISLWTRGRVTGFNRVTNAPTRERLPGCSSLDLEQIPESDSVFTAQEPSEFWCINYTANRRRLPLVDIVRARAGESVRFLAGTKLLLCSGAIARFGTPESHASVSAPKAIQFANTFEGVAIEDTHGFVFLEG